MLGTAPSALQPFAGVDYAIAVPGPEPAPMRWDESEQESGDWFSDDGVDGVPCAAPAEAAALRRKASEALVTGDVGAALPSLRALMRLTSAKSAKGVPSRRSVPRRMPEAQRRQHRAAALRGLAYAAAEAGRPATANELLRRSSALAGATASALINQLHVRALCGDDDSGRQLELAEKAVRKVWAENSGVMSDYSPSQLSRMHGWRRRSMHLLLIALRERAVAAGRLAASAAHGSPSRMREVDAGMRRATLFFYEAEEFGVRHGLPLARLETARNAWVRSLPGADSRETSAQQQWESLVDAFTGFEEPSSAVASPSPVLPPPAAPVPAASRTPVRSPSSRPPPVPSPHRSPSPPSPAPRAISPSPEAVPIAFVAARSSPRLRGTPKERATMYARRRGLRRSSFFEFPPKSGKGWFFSHHGVAEPASDLPSAAHLNAVPRRLRGDWS